MEDLIRQDCSVWSDKRQAHPLLDRVLVDNPETVQVVSRLDNI